MTFELAFSHIISEFGGRSGGGGGVGFKTSNTVLENLGNVREKIDKFENFRAI